MVWSFRPPSHSRELRRKLAAALVATIVGTVAASLLAAADAPVSPSDEYAIVVSSDVSVEGVSMEQLRRYFLFREKFWKPGHAVRVLYSEDDLVPRSFLLEHIYRRDYPSLRRFIVEKLYQGEIDLAPKVVASDEVAVAFVDSGSGLIALVRASAARGTKTKVIAVDGLLPGAPGYSLRR